MIRLRLQRSINGPIKGPRATPGSMLTSIAVERIVAEPVSRARYQASVNPTMVLPNMEAAWLDQRTKNFFNKSTPSYMKGNYNTGERKSTRSKREGT